MRSRLCPEWASYEHATRFKFSPDNFFRGRLEHFSDGVERCLIKPPSFCSLTRGHTPLRGEVGGRMLHPGFLSEGQFVT